MYSAEQSNLVVAYGDFLHQWAWDQYATLTFGRKQSEANCIRLYNQFINSLGRTTHGRVGWVRADEKRWSGFGSPEVPLHFHSLLKYQHAPAREAVAALWKSMAGDALIESYRSGGGAAYYIAKMFPDEGSNYAFGGLEHFDHSEGSPIRGSVN
jgi:hypothetical protein